MKKNYKEPNIYVLEVEDKIIATSGGVDNDGTLGRSYISSDVSYSKERNVNFSDEESIW